MATLPAEWTGVIKFGTFELDCRLFSANGKAQEYPMKMVHILCHTEASLKPDAPSDSVYMSVDKATVLVGGDKDDETLELTQEYGSAEADVVASVNSNEQMYCPHCQKYLKSTEMGTAVQTDIGLIAVSQNELDILEFKPCKLAPAHFMYADDSAIDTIGVARWLYVIPKPTALQSYANLYHSMVATGHVGFIPLLIIKRKPRVAILKPMNIPDTIFGARRELLAVGLLTDTDTLRDPASVPGYFGVLPKASTEDGIMVIEDILKNVIHLDIDRCINPKRRMLRELIIKRISQVMKKKRA